jgi:hypothetical protein
MPGRTRGVARVLSGRGGWGAGLLQAAASNKQAYCSVPMRRRMFEGIKPTNSRRVMSAQVNYE